VIGDTMRLTAAGVAIGTIASLALARLIASLLYATSPFDAMTFVIAVVVLTAVALLAGYLPALRASRIEPMRALRD
jgi:putative ABC transport system permease protein